MSAPRRYPICAVNSEQARQLVTALYALGWRERSSMNGSDTVEQALTMMERSDAHYTHIWLYDAAHYPKSIWTCGPERPFASTFRYDGYGLTLVNSLQHTLDMAARL